MFLFFTELIFTNWKSRSNEKTAKHPGSKLDEAFSLLQDVQELYIDDEQPEEEIDEWTAATNAGLRPFEEPIADLDSKLKYYEKEEKEKQTNEQLEFEAELEGNKRKEQSQAEEARQEEFVLELEKKKLELTEKKRMQAKLPDLQISKFQRTHLAWVRFWSLFKTQIDKAQISDEAKFSYLRQLVVPKVRATIEKLPTDSQGYQKAKSMLEERYGDPAEVVNVHVQKIISLPAIHGTRKQRIHDFYDQLLGHVQALNTLGRLNQVNGTKPLDSGFKEIHYNPIKEKENNKQGKYVTYLPWKAGHPELPTNKGVAESRFHSLIKRLDKQPELFQAYHKIIDDQLQQGIVEIAPKISKGKEHYFSHKPVVGENEESTKVMIVYDASAKATPKSPSLNDCLDIGPPLQAKILDILLRVHFKPVLLAGDIQQAFLQIMIREQERDALRFIWVNNTESKKPIIYQVTHALCGLGPNPFLLGGTLEEYLGKFVEKHQETVQEIKDGLYFDDINLGSESIEKMKMMKETVTDMFQHGGFKLHKFHSNIRELEGDSSRDDESTFVKESLGTKSTDMKLLGLNWEKKLTRYQSHFQTIQFNSIQLHSTTNYYINLILKSER
eukprot:gene5068-biopygen4123